MDLGIRSSQTSVNWMNPTGLREFTSNHPGVFRHCDRFLTKVEFSGTSRGVEGHGCPWRWLHRCTAGRSIHVRAVPSRVEAVPTPTAIGSPRRLVGVVLTQRLASHCCTASVDDSVRSSKGHSPPPPQCRRSPRDDRPELRHKRVCVVASWRVFLARRSATVAMCTAVTVAVAARHVTSSIVTDVRHRAPPLPHRDRGATHRYGMGRR